jgi:hypothetical protein
LRRKDRQRLQSQIAEFMKRYGRTADRHGRDLNGRQYDRDLERWIKRMDPIELDRLLRAEGDDQD